jgi:hypothetical protein
MTMKFKFTDQDGFLWTIQQDNNQWVCSKGDHDFGSLLKGKTPGEVVDAIVGFVGSMHSTTPSPPRRRRSRGGFP